MYAIDGIVSGNLFYYYSGAVVSLVISNMLPPLMVIGYIWFRKLHKETWGGWSFEALEEWWLFFKLAVPGFLMTAIPWIAFEVVNFISGSFGEEELSVNIVWYQLLVIMFMVRKWCMYTDIVNYFSRSLHKIQSLPHLC